MVKKLKSCFLVIGLMLAASAALSAIAGGQNDVQSALDKLYPGWTASNVGDICKGNNRDCGLHDGIISIHPLNKTVPATLTRVGSIKGDYPVLHLRVSSVNVPSKANLYEGDWVFRMRVNGRQVGDEIVIASPDVRDLRFPLAAWANRGDVKIELDNACGGANDWAWELGFWHLIEIVEDESAYAVEKDASAAAAGGERRISLADYRDKMQAAWIGQVAGATWGDPTEFMFNWKIIPMNAKLMTKSWEEKMINGAFGQDDLYVEMTFIDTLDRCGWDVSAREAGIDFANSGYALYHANFVGRDNLRRGIAPPDTAHPDFNACANCIDYQIESDYSGILMPGYPQGAVILGEKFGRLVNYGDGLHAGQFVGAMYAEAYFESNRVKMVESALKAIPPESRYAEMVRDMLAWHRADGKDWERAWHLLVGKYGHEAAKCDKGRGAYINCTLNGGVVLLGLLWGEGDPDKTILIAMRGGFDSDCNPSSAAGVLFCSLGKSRLPKRFYEKMNVKRKFSHTPYNFPGLFAVCEKVTREAIVHEGGRIEKDADGMEWLVIPRRPLCPTPYRSWLNPAPQTGSRYTTAEMSRIKFARDSGWGAPCKVKPKGQAK